MTAVLGVDERALRAEVARQPEIDAANAATARTARAVLAGDASTGGGNGRGIRALVGETR